MWSDTTALEAELIWESDVSRIALNFWRFPLTAKTDTKECLLYTSDYSEEMVSYLLDYFDVDKQDWWGDEPLPKVTDKMFLAAKMSEQVAYRIQPIG
jgi:hypothetical protein